MPNTYPICSHRRPRRRCSGFGAKAPLACRFASLTLHGISHRAAKPFILPLPAPCGSDTALHSAHLTRVIDGAPPGTIKGSATSNALSTTIPVVKKTNSPFLAKSVCVRSGEESQPLQQFFGYFFCKKSNELTRATRVPSYRAKPVDSRHYAPLGYLGRRPVSS